MACCSRSSLLNLSLVGMSVVLSFWNREFYNSLQNKDWESFIRCCSGTARTESGFMPGFCGVAAVYIVVAVYRTYLNQWLPNPMAALADRTIPRRVAGRSRLLSHQPHDRSAAIGTDNPDQRIAEDLRDFVDSTLSLGLGLLSQHRLAVQLRRHSLGPLGSADAARRHHPRLHGLGRAHLRGDRHDAHPSGRPSAGRR